MITISLTILLPTYEEAATIQEVLGRIDAEFGDDTTVIVLNDIGDDRTGDRARSFSPDSITVEVWERDGRQGLGKAYRSALTDIRTEYIAYLDADLSHRPEDLRRMYERLQQGDCDLVIGSRFVEGGERHDAAHRQFPPLIGSWLYRYVIGLPVADVTSGIRVFDRAVLEAVDWAELPDDYSFQAAFTAQAIGSGLSVCEEPVIFEERKAGRSKYRLSHLLSNVVLLLRLLTAKLFNRSDA